MKDVSIIGVDLAKQLFQLHGATAEGEVVQPEQSDQACVRALSRWDGGV